MPASSGSTSRSSSSSNPLKGAVQILENRLYFCALRNPPVSNKLLLRNANNEKIPVKCFCVDDELVYWNFYLDFGPLNLGQLFRFTVHLNNMVQESAKSNTAILFYSSTDSAKRTNAIYLICAWQVLELKRTPEQAYYGFDPDNRRTSPLPRRCSLPPPVYPLTTVGKDTLAPVPPFHDASPVECTYDLNIMDCLHGLVKAKQFNFFSWDTFDLEEYEHFEQVENGDLNWIVQGKIIAFAGPSYKKTVTPEGYCTLAPADYIPYFKSKNVGLVVRLNKKNYNEEDFIRNGIQHLDQFYLDGSCPPMNILQRVLDSFESLPADKAFAVHCKAGLGRTGTCIGAYLMKHYRMTAPEVISWMRICRPGCVIGPQQQFLQDLESIMWQEGEKMRMKSNIKGINCIPDDSDSLSDEANDNSKRVKSPPVRTISESSTGRPGQADGLLTRRQQRGAAVPTTITPTKDTTVPVPVSPDSVSGNTHDASTTTPSSTTSPAWILSSSS
eukprot:Nitzschia sp. Nitz4//scaffold427_size8314//620//2324//NITZ4_009129-RA/size8314-snap-gene-0.9-mRNA-1//-1//CDS//3329551622//6160//frame0